MAGSTLSTEKKDKHYVGLLFRNHTMKRIQYLKCLKKNKCQLGILYQGNLSFENEGKTETFSEKQKFKESVASKLSFQEMLKVLQQDKMSEPRNWDLHKERKSV